MDEQRVAATIKKAEENRILIDKAIAASSYPQRIKDAKVRFRSENGSSGKMYYPHEVKVLKGKI